MDILLLTSFYPHGTAGSGVATSVLGIKEALTTKGHRVEILSPRMEFKNYLANTLYRIIFNILLPTKIKSRPHAFVGFDFDGFLLKIIYQDIPFISVNGGILADIVRFEKWPYSQILKFLATLERWSNKRADHVVVPSDYCKSAVQKHYKLPNKKISVIPFGIDHTKWGKNPREKRETIILSVARFYPRKGILMLLEAFKYVANENKDAILLIIGSGPLKKTIRSAVKHHYARQRIILTGELPRRDIPGFYEKATLFCLPSLHETFGFAYLEAMAAGLPIVALKTTALSELVEDQKSGLLLPEQSTANELAKHISLLIKDRKLYSEMSTNAKKRSLSFTWEKTGESFSNLLERLITRSSESS